MLSPPRCRQNSGPESGATDEGAELRALADRRQVGIDLHVGDVVVAQIERRPEADNRLVAAPGQGQRAGQIVAGEGISRQAADEPPVELEGPVVQAPSRGQFPQHPQDLDRIGIPGQEAFEEVEVEVELVEPAEPEDGRGLSPSRR